MRQFVLNKNHYSVFGCHVMRKEGRYDERRMTFYNAVAAADCLSANLATKVIVVRPDSGSNPSRQL